MTWDMGDQRRNWRQRARECGRRTPVPGSFLEGPLFIAVMSPIWCVVTLLTDLVYTLGVTLASSELFTVAMLLGDAWLFRRDRGGSRGPVR